jgi:PKD repeat protein/Flp pilus assembly pilin Flp
MYPIQSRGQKGQGGTEYALLLASISLVIIFVSGALFTVIKTQFRNTLCEMDSNGQVQYECNDGVEPGMPIASFTVTCPSLSCTIDAATSRDTNSDGTGVIVSYEWDFGDSTFGTGETPSKTYGANGTYTITLVVTDDDGNTASTTRSVYAELPNLAPIANFTVVSCTDLTCSFDAGASSDPDVGGSIVSYEWSYGDGNTGTGVTSSRTYLSSGLRTVTLKVTDNGGKAATTTRQVTPTVPAAMLAHVSDLSKTTATSGSNWTATITITVKNGNNVAMSGATVRGSFTNGGGSGLICPAVTDASGQCTITSQGVPKNGGSAVSNMTFTVDNIEGSLEYYSAANIETTITATIPTNAAPTITNMTVNCADLVCNFSGTATDDGSFGYSWDFGGGGSFTGGSATAHMGIYTYSSAGTYNIKLTVVDNLGETVEATINQPVTAAVNAAPVASFTVSCPTLVCNFTSTSTDDVGITSWLWNFGDSTTGTGSTISHTYASAGAKSVVLTVSDGLLTNAITITANPTSVPNTAPVASFTVTCANLVCSFDGAGSTDNVGVTSWSWNFGDSTTGTGSTISHTYASAGAKSVVLTVSDGLLTNAITITANPTAPTATSVNITDLDGTNDQSGNDWTATITITVKNNLGVAVSGATVTGSFNNGGGTNVSCASVTNASGQCTITSGAVARTGGSAVDSLTFTMSNVTGSLTYNSAANADPDGDSTGTAITVAKP